MKLSLQSALAAAVLLLCPSVWAQKFAEKGQFAVSAERLFGVSYQSATVSQPNGDLTTKVTSVNLLSAPISVSAENAAWLGYGSPRVAGDYFVIDHLSLGAALGYTHWSRTRTQFVGNGEVTTSGDSFSIAPRVGYAVAFSDLVGIWPRGGFTYRTFSVQNTSAHDLALTLEAPFTFSVLPHVVIWGGPTLDLGLTGSSNQDNGNGTTISRNFNATELGLQTGLLFYFGT